MKCMHLTFESYFHSRLWWYKSGVLKRSSTSAIPCTECMGCLGSGLCLGGSSSPRTTSSTANRWLQTTSASSSRKA